MPITPRYDWTQDFDSVSIHIYGPGFRPQHLEIAELYLGLNSAPYLLGLDLYQSVEPDQCQVRMLSKSLQVRLPKSNSGLWPELCLHGDPVELRSRRKQTIERSRQRAEERRQQALQQKSDSKSKAQKRVWDDEDRHRSLIEQLKRNEENEAKAEVLQWAESNEICGSERIAEKHNSLFNNANDQHKPIATSIVEVAEDSEIFKTKNKHEANPTDQERRLPGVRSNPAVLVRFTAIDQRAGPVARDPNEDDEFAVCSAISNTTEDVTDGHAQLLYEKGLKFQRSHDYLSAISAFSSVLQLSATDTAALLNRARSYLKLASFRGAAITKKFERIRKCIADSNLALARACPPELRSDLLQTRAQANLLLGNFPTAISDLEDAMNLSISDSDQESALEMLEQASAALNRRQNEDQVDNLDHIQDLFQITDLISIDPCCVRYLLRQAQIYSDLGQQLEAVDSLTECLAIIDDPVLGRQIPDSDLDQISAQIYQLRGMAHLALEHFWQAGDDFSAAIRHGLQPDLVKSQIEAIEIRLAKHSGGHTESESNPGKDKDPLQSLIETAAVAFRGRDAIRAKRLYSEALRLNPPVETQSQILSNRAATELFLHQYDACIRDCTSSLELGSNDPVRHATTLSRRAAAYSGMGSLGSARDDLRAALSLLEPGTAIAQQISNDLRHLTECC